MPSKADCQRDAEILLEVAKELHRLADEATERARAAFARLDAPMPLFRGLDEEGR